MYMNGKCIFCENDLAIGHKNACEMEGEYIRTRLALVTPYIDPRSAVQVYEKNNWSTNDNNRER